MAIAFTDRESTQVESTSTEYTEGSLQYSNWEAFIANPAVTPITFRSIDLPANCALTQVITDLRTRFVEHQGWVKFEDGQQDRDFCDFMPETQVFAAGIKLASEQSSSDGAEILTPIRADACMRLTRISSLRESLSFSMWADHLEANPSQQEALEQSFVVHRDVIQESADAGRCFDLSRLCTDYESRDFRNDEDRAEAMREAITNCFLMFGAGVAHSRNPEESLPGYEGPKAIWTFTINDSVRMLLDATGIQYHTLLQGEITPGDGYSSSLCYLSVEEGLSQVSNVPGFVDARDLVQMAERNHLAITT